MQDPAIVEEASAGDPDIVEEASAGDPAIVEEASAGGLAIVAEQEAYADGPSCALDAPAARPSGGR